MGGRETGDSGGWVAAIFSPLGVPTSAREGGNRVSPLIPCYNMKIEKIRKNINVTFKCTVQLISVTAAPSKMIIKNGARGGGGVAVVYGTKEFGRRRS